MRQWLTANAEPLVFGAGLLALTVGFALAWLPLGLIIPGALVVGCLAWKHLRGGND